MSSLDGLKRSITVTLNEICMAHFRFAKTQGLDLRDDTYLESLEIIARLERKMLAKQPNQKLSK